MWTALISGLPKKGTSEGDRLRSSLLGMLGLIGLSHSLTHDQNDAAIAAVAAAALDGVVPGVAGQLVGDALYVDQGGILREGPMVRLVVNSADLRRRLTTLVAPALPSARPMIPAVFRPIVSPAASEKRKQWSAADLHARFVEAVNGGRPMIASYSWVYSRLFGSIPTPWSQGYAGKVASIAQQTIRSQVNGLGLVALDTFVVATTTRVPSPGHWPAVSYQKGEWDRVFRGAQLLHGVAKAPWEF
jgi:hypothetical protein